MMVKNEEKYYYDIWGSLQEDRDQKEASKRRVTIGGNANAKSTSTPTARAGAPSTAPTNFVLVLSPNSDICEFEGDSVVTSAGRQLQGPYLRNWWGFVRPFSQLHRLYNNYIHDPK